MNIGQLTDTIGQNINYIKDLKKGDKLRALKDIKFKSGNNGIYDYKAFIKDKIYIVDHIYNWDGEKVAYVSDEDNTLWFAIPETFDIV